MGKEDSNERVVITWATGRQGVFNHVDVVLMAIERLTIDGGKKIVYVEGN